MPLSALLSAAKRERTLGRHPVCVTASVGVNSSRRFSKHSVVDKVMLKAVSRKGKKSSRSFLLRNLNPACVSTCEDLKAIIRSQPTGDITSKDFDVGYCHGSSVVGLRSTMYLHEVWGTTLWCDGLRVDDVPLSKNRKQKYESDSEEDDVQVAMRKKNPARQREEKIQDIMETLLE